MSILDYAYHVLRDCGEQQLHFKELYRRAQALGWVSTNAQPERQMYRAIRANIREYGLSSRFRQPSDATLALATQHPEATPLSPVVRKGREQKIRARFEAPSGGSKVCGACKHVSYPGPHINTMKSGICDLFEKSGQLCVRSMTDHCPYWERRSAAQEGRDYDLRLKTQVLVEEINKRVARMRRG